MKDSIFDHDVMQLMPSTALTASKTDMTVVDLAACGIQAGPAHSIFFLVGVDAITTADASNYFTFDIYHADAQTSSTALTSGVLVTATTGLLNAAAPTIAATTLTTQAQKCILIGYRGIKPFIQLQPTETGTAAVTVHVDAIFAVLDSTHGSKLA